jgi:hypothetical protein
MVLSPISPKPKSEKEKKERNCMDLNKKLSISFVHVIKNYTHARQQMHVNFSTPSPTKLSITFVHTQNNTPMLGKKDHTNISTHHGEIHPITYKSSSPHAW